MDERDGWQGGPDAFEVEVKVKTYWSKYDKKNALLAPERRNPEEGDRKPLSIPRSSTIQGVLGPKVDKVELRPGKDDNVLIDVSGENFYSGTTVIIGGHLPSSNAASMIIKSDHFLQITAKAGELAKGRIYLSGRYGLSAELLDNRTLTDSKLKPDYFNVEVVFSPVSGKQNNEVTIRLREPSTGGVPDIKKKPVIVTVGQQTFVLEHSSWTQNRKDPSLQTVIRVAPESLADNTAVTATIPFLGVEYHASTLVFLPANAERAILLADGETQTWGIVGTGFTEEILKHQDTVVTANSQYVAGRGLELKAGNLLTFSIPKVEAAKVKSVVVKLASLPSRILTPPNVVLPVKVSIVGTNVPTAAIGTAPAVEFAGENLDQTTAILFGEDELQFATAKPWTTVKVFLTRKVTEKAGRVALALKTKDGDMIPANLEIR